MVGRQFSFFWGPEDQLPFEMALRETGDVAFLKERSRSPTAEVCSSSVISEFGKEWLGILVARSDDVGRIRFRPIRGRVDFSCDPVIEPIVEFSRCYVDNKIIRPGRLYRVDEYFDDGDVIRKSATFIKWAEKLFDNGRAGLEMLRPGLYAGFHASKLREAGILFDGLDVDHKG